MKSEKRQNLLDHHFAKALAARSSLNDAESKKQLYDLLTELSSVYGSGSSCLKVSDVQKEILRQSGLVSDQADTPLVLVDDLLYLQRYFVYESRLASQLADLAAQTEKLTVDEKILDQFFGQENEPDMQRLAARVALDRRLCIISGGPGTGKTTTILKILALLQMANNRELNIALAAPTGKAAMRLMESVGTGLEYLAIEKDLAGTIPQQALTLHRLLGTIRHCVQFRHNKENPLSYDVVVVDEASMVDLAMMSKLVDAMKPGSRLILLGDKDQLASVESGAVLADLIASLPDNTVTLTKTFRFNSNIKQFSDYIIQNNSESAWSLLNDKVCENVKLISQPLEQLLKEKIEPYSKVLRNPEIEVEEIFKIFQQFQTLCAINNGPNGVENINRMVELHLNRIGFDTLSDEWYHGRPVMVSTNDYGLGLYNGDVGICLKNKENGDLAVWFQKPDRGYRCYPPYRLPLCTTVFAMTIHKSQGSEFNEVLVVLPDEDARILSRELIYTGVTRAKGTVSMRCVQDMLILGLSRGVERTSGLAKQLGKSLNS